MNSILQSTAIEVIISVFMINLRYLLLNLLIFRQLKSGTKLFEKGQDLLTRQ